MIDRVQRINWIDWSKVFAIYLVALGHLLGNTGMEGYLHNCIYLFHMPSAFFTGSLALKRRRGQSRGERDAFKIDTGVRLRLFVIMAALPGKPGRKAR